MRLTWCAAAVAVAFAAPARADHPVSSGTAGGGGISMIGPDTLAAGAFGGGLRLSFVKPDRRSDEELADLAGAHVHAHDTDATLTAALGAAYGVTDRLTLSAQLPYIRRDNLRAGEHNHSGGEAVNEVVRLGDVGGVGDLSLLAKYRLLAGGSSDFALLAGVKAPTGSTDERSDDGERLETEHQPGTGSWDPLFGAAWGTGRGSLRINASALYQLAGKGAQDTRLGDRAQAGLSLSHRFGPAEHHHSAPEPHDHGEGTAAHDHPEPPAHGHAYWDVLVEFTGEWEGRKAIAGEAEPDSGGKAIWLSPGARYTSASGLSAALGVGVPLWQRIRASHPESAYRVTLSLGSIF